MVSKRTFSLEMIFLGDTRSAEELAVFTNMAPERLCLGCGLQADEKFRPIFSGERGPLLCKKVADKRGHLSTQATSAEA